MNMCSMLKFLLKVIFLLKTNFVTLIINTLALLPSPQMNQKKFLLWLQRENASTKSTSASDLENTRKFFPYHVYV